MTYDLKIYKQVNTNYWNTLEIGKYYFREGQFFKLIEKPAPEVIRVQGYYIYSKPSKIYQYYETMNWKDYDCAGYQELSAEQYADKIFEILEVCELDI